VHDFISRTFAVLGRKLTKHSATRPPSFFSKKIYRLKEDQAFPFRWNWVKEKKLRGIRLQISSFTALEGVVIL
jgi:hypothetical protein